MEAPMYNTLVTVLTYIVVLLVGLWCWFQWTHRHLIRAASKLPCPFITLPFIGNAHITFRPWDKVTSTLLDGLDRMLSKGIHTFVFWCGPLPYIVVSGVEDVKKVLTSSNTTEKGDETRYFSFALGDGLLTAPADIWRLKRRSFSPLFHPRNVDLMVPTINKNCRELVTTLAGHVGQGPVDLMHHNMATALHSVINLVFGPEVDFVDKKSEYFKAIVSIAEMIPVIGIKRAVRFWLREKTIFDYLYRKELKQFNDLLNTCSKYFLEKSNGRTDIELHGTAKDVGEKVSATDPAERLNLPMLYKDLQLKSPQFGEEHFKFDMLTVTVAGTDTVAVAVSTCLLLMATYQDMQEKLYQEICSVVEDEDDITLQDMNNMSFLDQVCKETLRWATISPFVVRKPAKDLQLSSCTIPAGCSVFLSLRGLLMDPKMYPDPKKFDPGRFSPERVNDLDMNTFLPFSGGPRNCIGKYYAEIEMRLMVAHVIRRYRLSTAVDVHNIKKSLKIFLVSEEGYFVSLEDRTRR